METITIGCKLPNGIILKIFEMKSKSEAVMGGGMRDVLMAHDTGKSIKLNGNSFDQLKGPGDVQIVKGTGFALTMGVDKALWDAWYKMNSDCDLIKNGLIFAQEKKENVSANAKDHKSVVSGFERLNPKNMPKKLKKFTEEDVEV